MSTTGHSSAASGTKPAEAGVASAAQPKRVWLLVGDKTGDNAQLEVVRERLGWQVEYRRLTFLPRYVNGKPYFTASLRHVDRARSDPLEPPWPDMIFTIGRRPAMAALWVKARSGGRSRVVLFGRPKRWLERFDLVVTPAQYAVPRARNVVNITLPLMRADPERLAAARESWRARLEALPRPLVGVLVGGTTRPFRLDADAARDLLVQARRYAGETGTLYVTTSRRTPASAVSALQQALPAGGRLYQWGDDPADNPYYGLLAHADGFVVTGDSMSMLTEVARLGGPLAIYPLPEGSRAGNVLMWLAHALNRAAPRLTAHPLLERVGLRFFPRELTRIHQWLFDRGAAVPVGRAFPAGTEPVDDDLDRVAARVTALAAGDPEPQERTS